MRKYKRIKNWAKESGIVADTTSIVEKRISLCCQTSADKETYGAAKPFLVGKFIWTGLLQENRWSERDISHCCRSASEMEMEFSRYPWRDTQGGSGGGKDAAN